MTTFNVTYTAYEKGSSTVVSEGTIPVQTTMSNLAENTVKAMFNGCDVIIRYVTNA